MAFPISRRMVLQGLGASVALPWLEAMGPLTAWAAADAAKGKATPNRLAFLYVPNGKDMANWTPKKEGAGFDLPSILEPLNPHHDDMMLLPALPADKPTPNAHG